MNLIKRKSAFPSVFSDDFDSLFQGFFRPVSGSDVAGKKHNMPAVDIDERENSYLLVAELPGFDKDDISVAIHDGQLSIKAEHSEENEEKQSSGNVLKERRFGSYFRSFNFGQSISEQDIMAKYDKGVLELTIPKSPMSEQKAKQIEIR
ncbi:Hsp20/alpha crystallin family protein [Thalassomonas actiniarum]|uniref:Hsp20/alpha crystallin family protein n=1 Tax=Thalassomonas actiniarum TaxID=485447 RepID=A0AAF0C5L0_9GAMM|nr:Hsp20/alpha crystallin family protein [Thalassomonas actiniarum]WDE00975.1 Hsp20/alpha crystallin family protein [Thalassomonas actiniarum]